MKSRRTRLPVRILVVVVSTLVLASLGCERIQSGTYESQGVSGSYEDDPWVNTDDGEPCVSNIAFYYDGGSSIDVDYEGERSSWEIADRGWEFRAVGGGSPVAEQIFEFGDRAVRAGPFTFESVMLRARYRYSVEEGRRPSNLRLSAETEMGGERHDVNWLFMYRDG